MDLTHTPGGLTHGQPASDAPWPLVSVVIPLYNHARYVELCLDSIVNSQYRPVEILVLDDGSTDRSFEAAQAWSARCVDPEVTVRLARQTNQGLPKTLNRLVTWAAGPFILIIASDDYLLPGGVGVRVEALQAHPEWLAVFGDAVVVDETGRETHKSTLSDFLHSSKEALANPRTIALELILRWGVPGGALMVRRSAYDPHVGVGLYDETLPFEDRDFHLKALARGAVGFINSVVSAYRQHPGNFFKVKDRRVIADYYQGLYRCESRNASLFKGVARLALRLSARLALDLARQAEEGKRLAPPVRKAIERALRLIYIQHRIRVLLSRWPAPARNLPTARG